MRRMMFAVMAAVALCGCKSMEVVSYRTIGTVTISVDAARSAWNQYVRDGHATPDQMIAAQDAYTKYQSAMKVLSDIVTAAKTAQVNNDAVWQAAIDVVSSSAADFVALVESFTTPNLSQSPQGSQRKGGA